MLGEGGQVDNGVISDGQRAPPPRPPLLLQSAAEWLLDCPEQELRQREACWLAARQREKDDRVAGEQLEKRSRAEILAK